MNLYISYVLKNVEGFIFLDVSQMNKWNVIFVILDLKSRDVLPFHNIRLIISLSPDNKAHFLEVIRPNTLIMRKQALLSQDNEIITLLSQEKQNVIVLLILWGIRSATAACIEGVWTNVASDLSWQSHIKVYPLWINTSDCTSIPVWPRQNLHCGFLLEIHSD